ncbi:CRISPR-associated endonuclease/helicase Cas3 [Catalinimonas alkaloidigena]|uniref:CRISPR-associated endonuclease/helicase Cas3 n=1 Tax=Catalinimonas alkaloidigena TaxID=1075417 RepID=A0A1G9TVB4_9BACT|nr:CRISPR-associated helicase/endonuclease Cas3 [Catalinimonas alkaloidigena]SDM51720.1 CRISPR-associated endonuclease/helicase Cas3 [Catalinimonas alkaloidigena]
MILLAKSPKQGGLLLEEHTRHVVEAIEVMAPAYGLDVRVARLGAVLHDLGKGHPAFQAMLLEKESAQERDMKLKQLPAADAIEEELRHRSFGRNHYHRHELSSLLFLPLFPLAEREVLIQMVVAHHKSIRNDRSQRGLLDLVKENGVDEVFERHFEAWPQWSPVAAHVAAKFGVAVRTLAYEEVAECFQRVYDRVRRMVDGWSPWKGLLMSADHFGSAYLHETITKRTALYHPPDLSTFEQRAQGPKAKLYPLSEQPVDDPATHTLVIAPTGAGKTDFLIRRCRGRIFYTLPFQASINAMYQRLAEDVPDADVRRLHAASRLELADEADEDVELQMHPGAGIKVMTPHQLAGIVFGTPKYEAIMLDLQGQDVILDEIHTYDGQARAMVVQMVRTLVRLDCRVHIGSATIPTVLADTLVEVLGGSDQVDIVRLPPAVLDTFDRHQVHKVADETTVHEVLRRAVDAGEHVLWVSNRVKDAQENYRWATQHLPKAEVLLIHSRFRRGERRALEARVKELQHAAGPCVVCATQVVEVSLDISYDRMVTAAAPLDALIQRFGRVNRIRNEATIGTYKPVHVVAPPEDVRALRPYEPDVVRASYAALPDEGKVLAERDVQLLIDGVYPTVEVPDQAQHFIMREDGTYRIRTLQHHQKSVLLEALDIDSATCVRQSDVAAYRRGPWDARVELEIPVSHRLRYALRTGGAPLEYGSYPYVIPDDWYHPGGLLLGLVVPAMPTNQSAFDTRFI